MGEYVMNADNGRPYEDLRGSLDINQFDEIAWFTRNKPETNRDLKKFFVDGIRYSYITKNRQLMLSRIKRFVKAAEKKAGYVWK
jgi:hypothetical protein